jgi:hypothetical protein
MYVKVRRIVVYQKPYQLRHQVILEKILTYLRLLQCNMILFKTCEFKRLGYWIIIQLYNIKYTTELCFQFTW